MASRVSERGQITLDRVIRKQLGIQPGMIAFQRVVAVHLEVVFLPEPYRKSLRGAFHRPGEQPRVVTSEQIEETIREAIAEEQS